MAVPAKMAGNSYAFAKYDILKVAETPKRVAIIMKGTAPTAPGLFSQITKVMAPKQEIAKETIRVR